jgi:prephenate dehydratase
LRIASSPPGYAECPVEIGASSGAHKKSCETIAEAVKFVMETLPEPFRAVAYMAAADKHLRFEEIRAIYESAEYKAFKA